MIFARYFSICALIFVQCFLYFQFILNDYKLANEYRYIDEITILGDKNVSNEQYIDENLLFLPSNKYKYNSDDVFLKTKRIIKDGDGLSFNNIPNFQVFDEFEQHSYNKILNIDYNFKLPKIKYSQGYDLLESDLYINKKQFGFYLNEFAKNREFYEYPLFGADTIEKLREKVDFIRFNTYEKNMQIFDRYYIHENSFVLAPLNEMNLGRETSQIFSQYGFLSIKVLNFVMNLYGGFSISNYEKAKKTIDLVSYLVAIFIVFLIFKSNFLRIIFLLIFTISYFATSFYALNYAPTTTNLRQMLLFFVIFSWFWYSQNRSNLALISAFSLSILSIWLASDFGLFAFLSSVGAFFLPFVKEFIKELKFHKGKFILFALFVIFGLLSLKFYPLMKNPSVKYFLDGFYSFEFSRNIYYFLALFAIFIQWLCLFIFYDRLKEAKFHHLYIFLIFYTQFLCVYFVWHGSLTNLLTYAFIYALSFMILFSLIKIKITKYFYIASFLILGFICAKFGMTYFGHKALFEDIFKTHKTYKWNHPRVGGITSTIDFAPFENSINLIQKHSKNVEIFMISKYDNILGILSEKYSGFPFFELRSTLVTKDEVYQMVEIINNRADILFVDRDIDRNFDTEMAKMSFFDLEPFWRNESLRQRIPKLKNLKFLFDQVRDDYELIEQGELINVYKKK